MRAEYRFALFLIRSRLDDPAGLFKRKPWRALKEILVRAVADRADEVRLDPRAGEKFRIDPGVVEAGHGPAVEAQGAGGQHQIGALQRAVAKGGGAGEVGVFERVLGARIVREELRHLFREIEVVADDHGHRRLPDLWRVAGNGQGGKLFAALGRGDPDEARRTDIGRGWAHLGQVVDGPHVVGRDRLVGPAIAGAGGAKYLIQRVGAEGLAHAGTPSWSGEADRGAARASARPASLRAHSV